MSTASRGAAREHQVKRQLEAEGWAVTRGAGSHGCADLWAALRESAWGFGEATMLRLIQVKTDKASPWQNFRKAERAALSALAKQTGGIAELWHWPANKPCTIFLEKDWPVAA